MVSLGARLLGDRQTTIAKARLHQVTRDSPFDLHHGRYEAWFEEHAAAYVSELLALRLFVPLKGRGLEIGVGSGRFAPPLGIEMGVEPSAAMRAYATQRGIDAVEGTAEDLPFTDETFDHVLVVTTICFVDSPPQMLAEAHRVLKPGGRLVIGFIDRESDIGRHYQLHKDESFFYRTATFYSSEELEQMVQDAGFRIECWAQTLQHPLAETCEIEPVQPGRGRCAFVAMSAVRAEGE